MEQYKVTGMSCAACVARVEKAVQSVPGVDSVAVSLLTNSMSVEGDASPSAIEKAVSDAGYGASPLGGASDETARNSALADAEEMLKDGEYMDPAAYFFAGVTPDGYAGIQLMASRTGQSLD